MKPQYELLDDHPPFVKGDKLHVTHRTTLYVENIISFDHPTEYKIVGIPKEKLKRLD